MDVSLGWFGAPPTVWLAPPPLEAVLPALLGDVLCMGISGGLPAVMGEAPGAL
jgi:hypothetical protein